MRPIYHVKVFGCAGATVLCVCFGGGIVSNQKTASNTCIGPTTSSYLAMLVQPCCVCLWGGRGRETFRRLHQKRVPELPHYGMCICHACIGVGMGVCVCYEEGVV